MTASNQMQVMGGIGSPMAKSADNLDRKDSKTTPDVTKGLNESKRRRLPLSMT